MSEAKSIKAPNAISVQSLSKTYRLYQSRYDMIKEVFNPFRKNYHKKFDALRDVSFDVERGEVVGIIGKNGSGKSTLLKILASVVTPTSGSFECNGRVTALLELGGGFNMELTGVQNIFYLGAIKGYSKKEMAKRLDEILDFAEIGDYASQPVKTYSSGMYVRLAFSMAININPDILITDEALSVGDVRFQQKCFRKIKEFKDQGKTIIICTHNLGAVKDFCTRAIWLHNGVIREQGEPAYIADGYNKFMASAQKDVVNFTFSGQEPADSQSKNNVVVLPAYPELLWYSTQRRNSFGMGGARIVNVAIINSETNQNVIQVAGGEKIRVFVHIEADKKINSPILQIALNGQYGTPIFKIGNDKKMPPLNLEIGKPNIFAVDFVFPHLGNGRYTFSCGIITINKMIQETYHWVHDVHIINVFHDGLKYKSGALLVLHKTNVQAIPLV